MFRYVYAHTLYAHKLANKNKFNCLTDNQN